jgi:hypothetical protein
LPQRDAVLKLTAAALVLSAVAAVVIWDPLASLARGLEVPSALPDIPKWLFFLLGKAKYILLAVIVLIVAVRRPPSRRSRLDHRHDERPARLRDRRGGWRGVRPSVKASKRQA